MKFHKINAVLFLIATAVSAYMVHNHYVILNATGSFHSFCAINKSIDCDLVNASRYSEYLGVPIATVGFAYSLFALILNFFAARNPYFRRQALAVLLPLSALSVVASLGNFAISFFALKTFCLFCMTHQAICIATFVLTVLAAKDFGKIRPFDRKKAFLLLAGGAALLGVCAFASSQLEDTVPFDKAGFLTEFRAQPVENVPVGNSPKIGFQGDHPVLQLVEFSDFQCPFCAMAAKHMHRLVRMYPDKIQLVPKNFPLSSECNPVMTVPMHPHACEAARAAVCASRQNKYLEMAEKLYENQRQIDSAAIQTWAGQIGLDMGKFNACLDSFETREQIAQDTLLGKSLGIESTPTFFVNGKKVEGLIDEKRLRALLKEYE